MFSNFLFIVYTLTNNINGYIDQCLVQYTIIHSHIYTHI